MKTFSDVQSDFTHLQLSWGSRLVEIQCCDFTHIHLSCWSCLVGNEIFSFKRPENCNQYEPRRTIIRIPVAIDVNQMGALWYHLGTPKKPPRYPYETLEAPLGPNDHDRSISRLLTKNICHDNWLFTEGDAYWTTKKVLTVRRLDELTNENCTDYGGLYLTGR